MMNVEELEIPVPWGIVAAKAWGDKKKIPVLMIHGNGDNAGSFDKLVSLLPTSFYYICIDIPGYGKSSHFPKYVPLHTLNIIFTYKLIVDHLKRDKYIVIGHSWGGRTMILFTQLFPESVLKLILIDPVYSQLLDIEDFGQHIEMEFEQMTYLNNTQSQSSRRDLNYEIAFKKIQDGFFGRNLDKKDVESILERSLVKNDNGKFYFTNDPRFRLIPVNIIQDERITNELIRVYRINCPVLIILATYVPEAVKDYRNITILEEILKYNSRCVVKIVKMDHDGHMKQPQDLAPLITSFLNARGKL